MSKAFALILALALPALATEPDYSGLYVTTKKPMAVYGPSSERRLLRIEKMASWKVRAIRDDQVFPHWTAGAWFHGILPEGSRIKIMNAVGSGIASNRIYSTRGVVAKSRSSFEGVDLDVKALAVEDGSLFDHREAWVETVGN